MRNYVTTYDPFFDLFFEPIKKNNHEYLMSTDILDKKDQYEMRVNVPSINKEDIKLTLKNGYLTIDVEYKEDANEEDNFISRERTYGNYSRSYYLGEDIKMKDISAKLDNGVLKVFIKKPNEEEVNKERYIEIQ